MPLSKRLWPLGSLRCIHSFLGGGLLLTWEDAPTSFAATLPLLSLLDPPPPKPWGSLWASVVLVHRGSSCLEMKKEFENKIQTLTSDHTSKVGDQMSLAGFTDCRPFPWL